MLTLTIIAIKHIIIPDMQMNSSSTILYQNNFFADELNECSFL